MGLKEKALQKVERLPCGVTFAYIVAAGLFGFDLIYVFSYVHDWTSPVYWANENGPAWVQAIGTLIAIAVAVFVPMRQRSLDRREKVADRVADDIARSEQLLALCSEVLDVISNFDNETVFGDNNVNNGLRRSVLNDSLARLNDAQKAEMNADRLRVAINLRFGIYDWLKYFGGEEPIDLWAMHQRVERETPAFMSIKLDCENILRRQKGQSVLSRSDLPEQQP